jgi:hypothetical protein
VLPEELVHDSGSDGAGIGVGAHADTLHEAVKMR